jgi:hypothetical protein
MLASKRVKEVSTAVEFIWILVFYVRCSEPLCVVEEMFA